MRPPRNVGRLIPVVATGWTLSFGTARADDYDKKVFYETRALFEAGSAPTMEQFAIGKRWLCYGSNFYNDDFHAGYWNVTFEAGPTGHDVVIDILGSRSGLSRHGASYLGWDAYFGGYIAIRKESGHPSAIVLEKSISRRNPGVPAPSLEVEGHDAIEYSRCLPPKP